MNTANALGFFLLGAFMMVAPLESIGYDTQSASSLWLQFMGMFTGFVGAGYLMREGAREAVSAWSRSAWRRAIARERAEASAAARQQSLPSLGGVNVTF